MTKTLLKDDLLKGIFSSSDSKSVFHNLRSFKREIPCEKLGLRKGERDHALEIITKLAYSKSEAVYEENYQCLLLSGLVSCY